MAVVDVDQLGHVDVAVVLFDGLDVGDEVAEALSELHSSGTVRIIDLAEVSKDANGTVTVIEPSEGETGTALDSVGDDPLDLLSESDLFEIGEGSLARADRARRRVGQRVGREARERGAQLRRRDRRVRADPAGDRADRHRGAE